jgi:allophanate hydrolase
MIEIIQTGPFNTVQDLGRTGFRNIGVTTSGAMDPLALKAGNSLLGNETGAAVLEVQTYPFKLRFAKQTAFAVTGADCGASLDGRMVQPWCALPIEARAAAGWNTRLYLHCRRDRCRVGHGVAQHVAAWRFRRQ